jgi:hypothetical protein
MSANRETVHFNPEAQKSAEPLMSEREVLEQMSSGQLVDLILQHGVLVSNYERTMNLAAEVLDGYGTTVEQVLNERQLNGNQT